MDTCRTAYDEMAFEIRLVDRQRRLRMSLPELMEMRRHDATLTSRLSAGHANVSLRRKG